MSTFRTRKSKTYTALNSRFLNTEKNRINEGYLNDEITLLIANTESLYRDAKTNRRKPTSVVWSALSIVANQSLEWGYGDKTLYASSQQLKDWLQEYGNGYDTLKEAVEYVQEMRRED